MFDKCLGNLLAGKMSVCSDKLNDLFIGHLSPNAVSGKDDELIFLHQDMRGHLRVGGSDMLDDSVTKDPRG